MEVFYSRMSCKVTLSPNIIAYVPFLGGEVGGPELEQLPERPEGVCPDFLRLSFFGKHSPRVVLDSAKTGID